MRSDNHYLRQITKNRGITVEGTHSNNYYLRLLAEKSEGYDEEVSDKISLNIKTSYRELANRIRQSSS